MDFSSSWRRRLARARSLTLREWLLVARLRLWLTMAWAGLRLGGFERTRRLIEGAGVRAARGDPASPDELERLAELVTVAARAGFLRHTCLPRSLVLVRMLRGRGAPAALRIGVHRHGDEVSAHAWVEVDGAPIGEPEGISERFSPLLADAV